MGTAGAKTPHKDKKLAGGLSADKKSYMSPQRRFPQSPDGPDSLGYEDHASKPLRELLRQLDSGIHNKETLLKMLVLKC